MSYDHLNGIMVDIETLGRSAGCVILSIGACRFDIDNQTIYDEFKVNIDAKASKELGLTVDKATLEWWQSQPKEVFKRSTHNAVHPKEAMQSFYDYVRSGKHTEKLWGWGINFDLAIIQSAMERVLGIDTMPWHYANVADARTVRHIFRQDIDRQKGVHHDALDDAKAQANYLIKLFNEV